MITDDRIAQIESEVSDRKPEGKELTRPLVPALQGLARMDGRLDHLGATITAPIATRLAPVPSAA